MIRFEKAAEYLMGVSFVDRTKSHPVKLLVVIHSRDRSGRTIDNLRNGIARQLTSVSMGLHDDDARTNTSNRVSACWLLKRTISSEKNLPSIDHSFSLLTIQFVTNLRMG